jgi:hypothetical protein
VTDSSNSKITKALARKLAQSKGRPVRGAVFAAVESEKLTLSSFAARAAQRNQVVRDQLHRIMERVQAWEAQSGQAVEVAFRPDSASLVLTAPAALFEALAGDAAVAAVDVETT